MVCEDAANPPWKPLETVEVAAPVSNPPNGTLAVACAKDCPCTTSGTAAVGCGANDGNFGALAWNTLSNDLFACCGGALTGLAGLY